MSRFIRIFALLAVIAGSVCIGYWMQRNVPDEKNRKRHPGGYSVCLPEGWSATVEYNEHANPQAIAQMADGLWLSPDNFDGIPPKLYVNRLAGPPDSAALRSDGFTDALFQGQPALRREKKISRFLSCEAVFERSGAWFDLVENLSVVGSVQKDQWWRFLETFRYPDGATPSTARAAPTSAPFTAPFSFPAAE